MKSNYLVWRASVDNNACALKSLENVDDDFELKKCVPRAKGFPKDAIYKMNPEYPKAIALMDNVFNTQRLVVISAKLKAFLEERKIKGVEYLPVSIINHKGRVASKDYFLLHPIAPQDALDAKKSEAEWSDIMEDEIYDVQRLVIDESKIDPEIPIFRLKAYFTPVLVQRKLADELSAAGFTGLRWLELNKYPE